MGGTYLSLHLTHRDRKAAKWHFLSMVSFEKSLLYPGGWVYKYDFSSTKEVPHIPIPFFKPFPIPQDYGKKLMFSLQIRC